MSRLASRLASLRLTLALLFALAALAAAGTFLPQGLDPEALRTRHPVLGPAMLALGLDHFYSAPLYRAVLLLFTANLMACAAGRSAEAWRNARARGRPSARTEAADRDWVAALGARGFRVTGAAPLRARRRTWAFLGFPLVHLAPPLVLAGVLWGSLAGFVATQNVYVGDLAPTVHDWSAGEDRALPFILALEDVRLHHYPHELQVRLLDAGEPREVRARVGTPLPVAGTPYRVRIDHFDPATGDLSYVVSGPSGEAGPFSRGREEGAPVRVRPLSYRDPEVRRAEALVSLRDARGAALARDVVAVNRPLVHQGLRIYLTAWGTGEGGRAFAGFQVVHDPGQPLVWTASIALCAGLLLALFGDGAWVRQEGTEILCRASRGAARARDILAAGRG